MDDPFRNSDGPILLANPHIEKLEEEVLYHLDRKYKTHDLPAEFGEVKFVCFGGSPTRMHKFAEYMVGQLKYNIPAGQALCNIFRGSDRYVLYKIGPVLSVSHGIGIPSLSVILHEILKLLYHAKCEGVEMFRLGTSGGLGLDEGTVVVTEEAVDGFFNPYMEVATLGKKVKHPAYLDKTLCKELVQIGLEDTTYKTVMGKTMCTNDFHEEQARCDGAFCDFTEEDKMAFLKRVSGCGVMNMEMESLCFAAMTNRARVKSAVLCCTIINRLQGDQVTASREELEEWETRPQQIVARYIRRQLGIE